MVSRDIGVPFRVRGRAVAIRKIVSSVTVGDNERTKTRRDALPCASVVSMNVAMRRGVAPPLASNV